MDKLIKIALKIEKPICNILSNQDWDLLVKQYLIPTNKD
jgi:hypothetical protein